MFKNKMKSNEKSNDIVMVSIICITYNHEAYIREAIESFLMQKTNFAFEIVIHDDCSTDGTGDIVREYAEKYPNLIKAIIQKENQYSQNIPFMAKYMYPISKGKYFAICEGDDYWIDPYKLQKQVDAMEKHPEVDACTHKQVQYHAITHEKLAVKSHGDKARILPLRDVIIGEGGYVGTNTMLYRRDVLVSPLPFCKFMSYDYTWQIQGALKGGILYLPECMSAYNDSVPGSFCTRMKGNYEAERRYILKKLKMLDMLDEDTHYVYHSFINARRILYTVSCNNTVISNVQNLLKYFSGFIVLKWNDRIKTVVRLFFPYILRQRRNLKK